LYNLVEMKAPLVINKLTEITARIVEFVEEPNLDALVLLATITGRSRTEVLAHPETALTTSQETKLAKAVTQIQAGFPLPYLIGNWEFFGLEMVVNHDVLIPRPETELLVENALDWLRRNPAKRRVMDIGTGSGCIAVTLAYHIIDLQVIATDISAPALIVARQNAEKFNVSGQIEFYCGNLFPDRQHVIWSRCFKPTDQTTTGADLIIANLPYIPSHILKGLKVFGREPDLALDGGMDGLEVIRDFIKQAPPFLNPGGKILVEIEASQGKAARLLAGDYFEEAVIHICKDLSGRDRLLEITRVA
jgi:release factor glutamine methyltransferase